VRRAPRLGEHMGAKSTRTQAHFGAPAEIASKGSAGYGYGNQVDSSPRRMTARRRRRAVISVGGAAREASCAPRGRRDCHPAGLRCLPAVEDSTFGAAGDEASTLALCDAHCY